MEVKHPQTRIREAIAANPFISKQQLFLDANVAESIGNPILAFLMEKGLIIKDGKGKGTIYFPKGMTPPEKATLDGEDIVRFAINVNTVFTYAEIAMAFTGVSDMTLRAVIADLVEAGRLFSNDAKRGRRYASSKELIDSYTKELLRGK